MRPRLSLTFGTYIFRRRARADFVEIDLPLTWEITAKNQPLSLRQVIGLHPRNRRDVQPRNSDRAAERASGPRQRLGGDGDGSCSEEEFEFGDNGVNGGGLEDDGDGQPSTAKRQRDATADAERLAARWREVMPKLIRRSLEATPAVWGGPLGGPHDAEVTQRACECTSSQCCGGASIERACTVAVDFVTTYGVAAISVPVYRCLRCCFQFHRLPVEVNAFPATPTRSVELASPGGGSEDAAPVWLDLHLLEKYFQLQFRCPELSEQDLCQAVLEHTVHGRRAERSIPVERLQKYIGDVFPQYLVFRAALQDVKNLGCPDYPLSASRLGICSACGVAGPDTPLHSIHFDACMKIKGFEHAARVQNAAVTEPMLNSRIIPAASRTPIFEAAPEITGTKAFCERVDNIMAGVPKIVEDCADFGAGAEDMGKASRTCSSTTLSERGLFSAVCSHGFIIFSAVMAKGERLAFAIMCLHAICKEQQCKIRFGWYDIGCRFIKYLKKYLELAQKKGLLDDCIMECLREMKSPLPPMHEWMHVLKCRSEHSHRGMDGAGTGVGDLVEGIWAHFGKYGRRYAIMSAAKRLTLLSANIDEWNRQKDVRFSSHS